MIVNIEKTIIRKKLYSLYKAVFLTIALIVILVTDIFYEGVFGINKYELAVILASIYLLSVVYNLFREYNYIYYSDEGDKIILRYFSPGVFTNKKNSIEIKKLSFAGFKTEKTMLGLKEKIILSQKTRQGIAKYPPVSITALSREEKKKILDSLNKIR